MKPYPDLRGRLRRGGARRPPAPAPARTPSASSVINSTSIPARGPVVNRSEEKRPPEYQYLDLLRELLEHGDERMDRTGVGTLARFGRQMRFDLADGFPAFTTKRVF